MSPKRLCALAAVAIVIAIAIGMLIFGGELNNFARRLMYVVLVGGILLGATLIVAGEGLRSEPSATLNRSRIHQARSRPNLLLGADRWPVHLTGLAAVILIFVVLMPYSAHFRIAIWIVVVAALRMIAKADPMIRRAMPGT